MNYTLEYDEENDFVSLSVHGEFSFSLFKRIATDVGVLLKEHNCNCILNNLLDAVPVMSITDTYGMPELALESGVKHGIRRALVVSEFSPRLVFLETVFINSGNVVKLFLDIEEARKWLSQDRTKS